MVRHIARKDGVEVLLAFVRQLILVGRTSDEFSLKQGLQSFSDVRYLWYQTNQVLRAERVSLRQCSQYGEPRRIR